jgi:hypothetical protein
VTGSDATVFEFEVPEARATDVPRLRFRIRYGPAPEQVDEFTLLAPKLGVAVGLLSLVDDGALTRITAGQAGIKVAEALWGVLHYVEEEPPEPYLIGEGEAPRPNEKMGRLRGQARLLERLNNPKDSLDIIDLMPVFERAVRAMFDRPTGPSRGSSVQPAADGTDSAAGSSEAPAETAGP